MNWNRVTEVYFVIVFVVLMVVVVFACNEAFGSINRNACNQHLYDAIYKVITREALHDGLNAKTTDQQRRVNLKRYGEIMSLRALCKGQVSTYERVGR